LPFQRMAASHRGAVDLRRDARIFPAVVMPRPVLAALLALSWPLASRAAPPAELAEALEHLRDQKTYSWEVINADPEGNKTSPHVKGRIDLHGDRMLERDWPDGIRLQTLVTSSGALITETPEGWMSAQDVLTAMADERLREGGPSPRIFWLRRADRPDTRTPDEELLPLLRMGPEEFESGGVDIYVARGRVHPDSGGAKPDDDDTSPAFDVVITIHLRGGVIRDYEVTIAGSRRLTRTHLQSVSDDRIVVLTYVPIAKLDVPAAARDKLELLKTAK